VRQRAIFGNRISESMRQGILMGATRLAATLMLW
jgi:hypothetical protein